MTSLTIDHDGIELVVSPPTKMDFVDVDAISDTEWKQFAKNMQIFDPKEMQRLAKSCNPKLLRQFFTSSMATRNLHQAARLGKIDVMKVLLDLRSVDVNKIDNVGQTALHYAAREGHLDIASMLLAKRNIDPDLCDVDGSTALHIALEHDHPLIFDKILKNEKVNVNKINKRGQTPLVLAAARGHEKIVDMLLKSGKVSEDLPNLETTPLHAATQHGHAIIVEKLLKLKWDVNSTAHKAGKSPLHLAVEGGHKTVVDVLLEAPTVNPSLKNSWDGDTPLHISAKVGNEAIFTKLLVKMSKVDVTTPNKIGMTALHFAANHKHVNIVKILLEKSNVDPCPKTKDGKTPLHMAATVGSVDVVEALLATRKVDVNITNSNKRTAIHYASEKGHLNVVEVLLGSILGEPNLTPCLGDDNDDTPLHLATKSKHLGIVERLLAIPHLNMVNKVNKQNETPLFLASKHGSIDVVHLLLENSEVDFCICDEHGDSPFHIAVKCGHVEIAKMLITHPRAFPIHANKENMTGLHLCIREGHENLVDMLLELSPQDANAKDAWDNFPIHYATQNGNVSILRKILNAPGVDVNSINYHLENPLHFAIKAGHIDVVDVLLQVPSLNASLQDRGGNSALHVAVKYNEEEIIEKLLKANGVDVNAKNKVGFNALMLAAEEGHVGVFDKLFAKSHNVYKNEGSGSTKEGQGNPSKSDWGIHPLLLAARNGHDTIIESLLAHGVDVNGTAKGFLGSAFHEAIKHGHRKVFEVLLKCPNIDPNTKDLRGEHPLFLLAKHGHSEFIKMLMEKEQIDVNVLSNDETALHEAAKARKEEVVKILLKTPGIDVHIRNKNNETALFHAARANNKTILRDIYKASKANVGNERCTIQTQLNINDVNDKGESIIHLAVQKKLMNVLDFLLEVEDDDARSVDVNMKTLPLKGKEHAQSALQIAIKAVKEATKEATNKATIKVECYNVVEKLIKFNSISFIQEEEGQAFLQHIFEQKEWETVSIVTTAPQVTAYIDALYKDRQASVDAANAILVGAALIAGVTFASWLQPPLGYTTYYHEQFLDTLPAPPIAYPEYVAFDHHPSLQAFWVFNSLSFFSAIATVISGARSVLPAEKLFIKQEVEILRWNLLKTSILLGFSMFFVLLAFATAGVIVLPPLMKFRANIFSTIGIGGSVCFIFLFLFGRSIYKLRSDITSSQANQKGFFKRWGFKPLHKPNLFNRSQGSKD